MAHEYWINAACCGYLISIRAQFLLRVLSNKCVVEGLNSLLFRMLSYTCTEEIRVFSIVLVRYR